VFKYIIAASLLLSLLQAKYFNTNPLIERGIDPQVLNLAVSIYKQDVSFEIDIKQTETVGNDTDVQAFKVLYDPYKKYGIDISIKVPSKEAQKYDESDIKKELDLIMGLQSYLQSEKLYIPESIKYIGKKEGAEVIEFEFDEGAIPRELKEYRHLKGSVYVVSGRLEKIVLTNREPFGYRGVDVAEYKKTLQFSKPVQGSGYLPSSFNIYFKGTLDEKPYSSVLNGEFVRYWDKDKKPVLLAGAEEEKYEDSGPYETISVNLDRTFPIYGQEVRKMGYDLPKPFGISLVNMYQETRFYMSGVYVDGVGDLSDYFRDNSKYENSTYAMLIRADMWVLPFLNFSLLAGGTSTSTDVNLDLCLAPGMGCPAGGIVVPGHVNTNSILYGAGATLGGGVDNFFASVDFQYMISYTDTAEVETQINIITPIFGYYFQSLGLRAYGGAMYEDLKEEMPFRVTVPNSSKTISGTINLKAEKWAGTLGAQYAFNRHWEGNLLAAYGKDFQNVSLVLTYRW